MGAISVVVVRWHGHACFEVVDSNGVSIVIDPHDGRSIGLKPPKASADAVLITHEHFDHNAYHLVLKPGGEKYSMREGDFRVVRKYGVKGIKLFHDKSRGKLRGNVVIYRLEVEGVRILHLGDLGHIPPQEVVNEVTPIEVLMVPVGGTFTIDAKEAYEVAKMLSPKVVVPMHYWVTGVNLPLAPLDSFLNIVDYEVIKMDSNQWSISKEELDVMGPEPKVVVFKLP